jgi:predicted transglutaminase-like cysteine proteinase
MSDEDNEKARELLWRSKFTVQPIIYKAQDNCRRDVRTFIFDKSHVLERYVEHFQLRAYTDTDIMYRILMWVIDNLRYTSDEITRKQTEYWQNPEETLCTLTGDCEDGALLIKSMSLAAGVDDWKVKVLAGNVTGGGHAYCTYIRDDDTQCILDWCYWSNRLPINERPSVEKESNYKQIWFSFDKTNGYAPKPIEYGAGKVAMSDKVLEDFFEDIDKAT